MYDYLEGLVVYKTLSHVTLEIQGVGYFVGVLNNFYEKTLSVHEDLPVRLYIHAHHTDHGIDLYGFEDRSERNFFKLLLSVSGVGPSLAIKILSMTPYEELIESIIVEDKESLLQVSGLGPKTAGKLLLELKDKVKSFDIPMDRDLDRKKAVNNNLSARTWTEVKQALRNLGYREIDIKEVMNLLKKEITSKKKTSSETSTSMNKDKDNTVESLLRRALAMLSPPTSKKIS